MLDSGFNIGAVRLENPLVLAPLAGVTNLPFRLMAKEQGAALTVTEMVSSVALAHHGQKTMDLLASVPAEKPLSVQIFGKNPEYMARAAVIAQEMGADIIDINMGCPARKVVRSGNGAALLKDFSQIRSLLAEVRKAVDIPLTVKTRAGWCHGQGEILDLAPILADCGVDALTLHPRFAVQGFSGKADWSLIARVVEVFPGPVIGNGDVTRPAHVLTMMKETGCSGVMIGRGAMGNPWLFREAFSLLNGMDYQPPSIMERKECALRHARLLMEQIGQHAVYMLRGVLMWYTKGLRGSAAFRKSINQITDFELLAARIEDYFDTVEDEPSVEETACCPEMQAL